MSKQTPSPEPDAQGFGVTCSEEVGKGDRKRQQLPGDVTLGPLVCLWRGEDREVGVNAGSWVGTLLGKDLVWSPGCQP